MLKYFIKSPKWLQSLFNTYLWKKESTENSLYLTFDDGPTPNITRWTLDILAKEQIEATFFVIGDNIRKHPQEFELLTNSSHKIGNHTYNHLVGWKTKNIKYFENVEQCQNLISGYLFRPPHGKIKPSQSKYLRKKGYKIIMWDVLSGDFDQSLTPSFCLSQLKKNTESGSIIVFHDSVKAENTLKKILHPYIIWAKEQGYTFKLL